MGYITTSRFGPIKVVDKCDEHDRERRVAEARSVYGRASWVSVVSIDGDMPEIGDVLYSSGEGKLSVRYS